MTHTLSRGAALAVPAQLLAGAALLCSMAAVVDAQSDTLGRRGLPRDVAREATALFNRASTMRTIGQLDVEAGRTVQRDVAVLNGPLTIAGHVTGRVTAINADVVLAPSARIDGDLLVIGGDLEGHASASVRGQIRIYRQSLRYFQQGEVIAVANDSGPDEDSWWRRWERRHSQNWSKFQIASAGAYNRVEGLPVNLGPQVQRLTPWGSVRLDAYGVIRTAGTFSSTSSAKEDDVGHNLSTEVAIGRDKGVAIGGRLFNVVDPVEDWQLTNLETGLASFVLHRDYRDYFQRHGGNAYVTLFGQRGLSLTGSFGAERWSSRDALNPFTLISNQDNWRPNPAVDEGLVHIASAAATLDTRNDEASPWSGWYVRANWERGFGDLTSAPLAGQPFGTTQPPNGWVDYSRVLLDLRRYNRVSPDAQLNFRLVTGGWVSGDPLPLERRLSVDGPGSLPGFGFRDLSEVGAVDVEACSGVVILAGDPANCERILLGQVEYRADLHFGFGNESEGPSNGDSYWSRMTRFHGDAVWVAFLDGGRGWNVHALSLSEGGPESTYGSTSIPPLSTFRADAGVGLDLDLIGVYVAKALSDSGEPMRFFVRLRHRF